MGMGVEGGLWGGGSEGLIGIIFIFLINVKGIYKRWIYGFLVRFRSSVALRSLYLGLGVILTDFLHLNT